MEHIGIQVFLLLLAIAGWAYCATPLLRYMIDLVEGQFRWKLILWFSLLVASIYLMKFCLYGLTHWPEPGSWASRLFFGFVLILSYSVPFIREWLRGVFKK